MPLDLTFYGLHKDVDFSLKKEFVRRGVPVHRGEWQAIREDRPQTSVVELYDVAIDMTVPESIEQWQEGCQPNLPWAEDHFQERVGGEPLNPGEQYKNWPWYRQGVEEHKPDGQFSHTYMERMWPPRKVGIRFTTGGLGELIRLLRKRPYTRQAYLPIWFPEDISAADGGERVPCSLGYLFQFNGQDGALDCWYYLRSCDFYRYMWDDIYMAGRLLQWVHNAVGLSAGIGAPTGQLHTKIANLHIFGEEFARVEKEYKAGLQERIGNAL